jgi:hypothetical protein
VGFSLLAALLAAGRAQAQVRGVYPLGMSATNSGVTPAAGFTYGNAFLFYSRDELKGGQGDVLATGQQSVILDMNSFVWVSGGEIGFLGGAIFSAAVTLPIASNSLTSNEQGAVSGGGGLGDSYFQPAILAWRTPRADVRFILGFLAPTGRFEAGASDNVGSGYWTGAVASGQTFYLTEDRKTALSLFEMYEIHSKQEVTDIHPGSTLDLDYSLTRSFALTPRLDLQPAVVGYAQWQTTAKTGPSITPEQAAAHYQVYALGVACNVLLPSRGLSLGFKYFQEFANVWTFQGHSVQISFSASF